MTAQAPMPWEERPVGASGPIWRNRGNPIIRRELLPRSNSIFNSAVVRFDGAFAGAFRVDDMTRTMNIHAGRSSDGLDWGIDPEPIVFTPADAKTEHIQERFVHAHDPRVTWIDDRYWVSWCNNNNGHGPTIGGSAGPRTSPP